MIKNGYGKEALIINCSFEGKKPFLFDVILGVLKTAFHT